jgi:hypothetical protein
VIKIIKPGFFTLLIFLTVNAVFGQGTIKGFVLDKTTGNPVAYASVYLKENSQGVFTDEKGFYVLSPVAKGAYTLVIKILGYDILEDSIQITKTSALNKNYRIVSIEKELQGVNISAAERKKVTKVLIAQQTIKPQEIKFMPAVGGSPDLIQYLQVMPGVVFSGDQGGQLYIRGGSPIMNKVLMDGMTIYNPFHSIGLFSVFDSDIIESVDVYSAGFGAEFGGRVSAIVDVKIREGNTKKRAHKIDLGPFTSKILTEGPLKFSKNQSDNIKSSYIVSYKNSFLDRTSSVLYPYAAGGQLPFSFSDLYAKWSVKSDGGSYFNIFAFDYRDAVNYENSASYDWLSNGFGANFLLHMPGALTLVEGNLTYSDYKMVSNELDLLPRSSGIGGFNANMNFKRYFSKNGELKYGIELNGFSTEFQIYNSVARKIEQNDYTTELTGFINYKKVFDEKLVMELGFRLQRYASFGYTSPEPRIRAKYNINSFLRVKASGGFYSQNMMSAVSDRDVVNLFYGFLSGPENLPKTFRGEPVKNNLQTARHLVGGFEVDVFKKIEMNIEAYVKKFDQITNINRDKLFDNNAANAGRPDFLKQDFIIEDGTASGFDISAKYATKNTFLWFVYAYNIVNRFDGIRLYQPHFDRRHNINIVINQSFGKNKSWSTGVRWNYGSGFPFTKTQGFYELADFNTFGSFTDYRTDNGDLGIFYDELNRGRLPQYHRLDASLTKEIKIKKRKTEGEFNKMEVVLSITNVYDRNNIFYFDRVRYERIDQLPILPAISMNYAF